MFDVSESLVSRDLEIMKFAVGMAAGALRRGEIPIASIIADRTSVISTGLNRRVATGRLISHAETTAIENAGRRSLGLMRDATLYSTLSPCAMCTGAVLLHRIPRVVVADRKTWEGPTRMLRDNGCEVVFLDLDEAYELMSAFRRDFPEIWDEDNGGN